MMQATTLYTEVTNLILRDKKISLILLLYVLTISPGNYASASESDHGEKFKRNNLGLFLGATDPDEGSTEFTYGVEYGYRFTPRFGAGLVYEKTEEAHDGDGASIILMNLYANPYANWRLGLGAGQEKIHGSHSHKETLYRLSAAYHFHTGFFGLAPMVSVDHVDGDNAIVFGVAISRSF